MQSVQQFAKGWTVQDRIPAGVIFFAPVQIGPGAHPSFLYNGYQVSLPGAKRPGCDTNQPPPSRAKVKERAQLCFYSPLWAFMACSGMKFFYYILLHCTLLLCTGRTACSEIPYSANFFTLIVLFLCFLKC